MQIEIDRTSSLPLYLQISNKIKALILDGYLVEGYKLPPERKLAEQLSVNRSTVLSAYRELKADGLLVSYVGQGTVVNNYELAKDQLEFDIPDTIQWKQLLSDNVSRMKESLSIDIMELANRPNIISFAAGISNPELDPIEDFKLVQEELLKAKGSDIFKITPTEGILPLKESIQNLVSERSIGAKINEIIVLSGSQQGIEFTARALINPGDIVIVEEPTFFCALQVFKALGARIISIPVDSNGMCTDILEGLLKRYKPVLIYTMPTFQNPTGVVMSLERRKHLLRLAYKYQIPILEDDPYYDLRYEGKAIPPIKAFDKYGYVIYISSFSKMLFQGLRVGWMIASPSFVEQISILKQMSDLHSSSLPQWIIDAFYRKGLIKKHINELKLKYSLSKTQIISSLEAHSIKGFQWNNPEGGLYLWCKLPNNINMSALTLKALSKNIAFLPGSVCFSDNYKDQYIRLNFTFCSKHLLEEGIKNLSEAIMATLKEYGKITLSENTEIKPLI